MQKVLNQRDVPREHLFDAHFSLGPHSIANGSESVANDVDRPQMEAIDRDEMYAQFAPLVKRLILHYGGCAQLREELVGEIYCRFSALLDAFDPTRGVPLRAYLVKQLNCSVYTYVRAYRRSAGRELAIEPGQAEQERGLSFDPTKEWDDVIIARDIKRVMPDALGALPDRQRRLVIGRYFENRSFEDLANALSIQPSSARSLLRHGLNNMRRWFAANYVTDNDLVCY